MSLVSWTKTFFSAYPHLLCRCCPAVCSGISYSVMALTTRAACLLRGNTLDLKPFLCPQAGYLWYVGPMQPSLNCLCPEPADTSYNGDIDVLLRNPWVRIKELLAAGRDGKRECVWTQDNVFLQHSNVHDHCCSLGPLRGRRRHFHVISHAQFMRSSQSNMLDNMLGLSVRDSCCAVVFPCGVCWGYVFLSQSWDDISFI